MAADLVGLRPRAVREALEKPTVKRYFQQSFASLREAEKPASVRVAAGIRDDRNLNGNAAGRRTQLEAAKLLLHEPVNHSVQVNQQFNTITGQPIVPGYTIDLRKDKARLGVRRGAALVDDGPVIDHNSTEGVS
ncbi:hypothetical protein [Rhizobium ruizarguesonis]|nr:hypothetical protein [Rhizobium ruizarguesonis]